MLTNHLKIPMKCIFQRCNKQRAIPELAKATRRDILGQIFQHKIP